MGAARALSELASSFHGADVLVLCYHRIRSRERFHSQMKALADHEYSILTMEQFTGWLRGSKPIHLPAALLTFDGCYDDQIENALPVLQSFRFPATFFPVSCELCDEAGEESVVRRHALRDLAKLGYTIGCHSHSHPDLTGLSKTELHREVHGSKQILEEVVGQRVTAFCYPYGAYDACVRNVVQAAGYDMAFTVDLGGVPRNDDPYLLKRVPVLGEPSVGEFRAYLSGTLGVSGPLLLYWKLRERLLDWRDRRASQKTHSGTNVATIDQLIAAYSRVSSANNAKFQKLKVVLARIRDQGIDCILLKGADLIPRLYGVLGLRPMVDVDLLVHDKDLPAIERILRELGYRTQIDGNPAYVDPDNTLALDIITEVWYVDDQNGIWQRAVQRDFDGIPVKGMEESDLLVYLTAYNVVHRGTLSESFAQDIALLVEKENVDWKFVLDETSRSPLKIPIYHGLSFVAARYASAPIPDRVLMSLAPATLRERIWYGILQKLVTDKPVAELGHLLLFLTQPGLNKWRWLKDRLFPSEAFLEYRYGHRSNTQPLLTRVCRPFSLIYQAVRLFARLARLQITGRL